MKFSKKSILRRALAALTAAALLGMSSLSVGVSARETETTGTFEASTYSSAATVASATAQENFDAAVELLRDGLCAMSASIDISSAELSVDDLMTAMAEAYRGAPAYFYARYTKVSYSYRQASQTVTKVYPTYYYSDYTTDQLLAMQSEMLSVAEKVVAQAETLDSSFDRVLYVHDWLIARMEYDLNTYSDDETLSGSVGRTAYEALVQQKGVCEAYDMAYRLILSELGFETGYALNDSHIWSMVKLDDEWYHVDVTMDDPILSASSVNYSDVSGMTNYNYFLVSDAVMQADSSHQSYTATNEAASAKYDSLFFRSDYASDACALANGQLYLVSSQALYTGKLDGAESEATEISLSSLPDYFNMKAVAQGQGGKLLLLGVVLSASGYQNLVYELASDGTLTRWLDLSEEDYLNRSDCYALFAYTENQTTLFLTLYEPDSRTYSTASVSLPLEHVAGEWTVTKKASCTETGLKVQTCVDCGEVLSTEEIPALGHTEGEWAVLTAPTADAQGVYALTCSVCGAVLESQTLSYGDLTLDGRCNVQDVMLLAQYCVDGGALPDGLTGNFNDDEKVDVQDVMQLAMLSVA